MMPVTIDPSETRSPVMRAARPHLRVFLLSGLGILGLAGFAALASSMLGGLAGPQFTRPTIRSAALTQKASEWPDLRDGVPALAPVKSVPVEAEPVRIQSAKIESVASVSKVAPVERVSSIVAVPTAPRTVAAPSPVQAAIVRPSVTPAAVTPETPPVPQKQVEATGNAAKPARLPPIENAAVLPPARPAALVPVARTVTLIPPSPHETTRSRATSGTFTALTSERETSPKRAAAAVAHAKPAAARPAPAKVAAAAAPEPQAEPEAEHTEVFGMKVPSLAPAGRKLAEGVEALGNAVKNLPNSF